MLKYWLGALVVGLLTWSLIGTTGGEEMASAATDFADPPAQTPNEKLAKITFGAGCFWCTEAVFQQIRGVKKVVSGYMGGTTKNPTYEQICRGDTGHAEVIQITYDPATVSFDDLLEVFWQTHDPTTLNRQGADKGTQYRSAIFFHLPEQRATAEAYRKKLDDAKAFPKPIVTEITAASDFYPAEAYHQNYYAQNSNQPYCQAVIRPKMDKLKKVFAEKLKKPE